MKKLKPWHPKYTVILLERQHLITHVMEDEADSPEAALQHALNACEYKEESLGTSDFRVMDYTTGKPLYEEEESELTYELKVAHQVLERLEFVEKVKHTLADTNAPKARLEAIADILREYRHHLLRG